MFTAVVTISVVYCTNFGSTYYSMFRFISENPLTFYNISSITDELFLLNSFSLSA